MFHDIKSSFEVLYAKERSQNFYYAQFRYLPVIFFPLYILRCLYGGGGFPGENIPVYSEPGDFLLRSSVNTSEFRTALLLSVVVALPTMADVILDFFLTTNQKEERLHWYSRVIILTALTGPNLLLLLGDFGELRAEVYIYGFYFFRIAITTCGIAYTMKIVSVMKACTLSRCISALIQLATAAYVIKAASLLFNPPFHNLLDTMSVAARVLCLFIMTNCGRELYIAKSTVFLNASLRPIERFIIMYLISIVTMNLSFMGISLYYGAYNDKNASSHCISAYIYVKMVFTVTVIIFQSRILRLEVMNQSRFIKERQAFIRYISHEIRTPLNTVFLGLEFVTSELNRWDSHVQSQRERHKTDDTIPQLLESVSDIRSSCQISLTILDDLLTFDKMEGGKMILELQDMNCCSFVSSVAKPFKGNAREKGITLGFTQIQECGDFIRRSCVSIDPSKMGQVVRNLISNAIKFTPPGGVVSVSVSHETAPSLPLSSPHTAPGSNDCFSAGSGTATPTEGAGNRGQSQSHWVCIEVRDTGVGISESNQQKLFGQYVQFDANKLQKGGGSGLGLWISKGITELHGGVIGAFSEGEGRGSVFSLRLPAFLAVSEEEEGEKEMTGIPVSDGRRSQAMVTDASTVLTSSLSTNQDSFRSLTAVIGGGGEGGGGAAASGPLQVETSLSSIRPSTEDSRYSPAPYLVPTTIASIVSSPLLSPAVAAFSSVYSSSMSPICTSFDTREFRDKDREGSIAHLALNDAEGFLSSADHFMVVSTPASRSSSRAARVKGFPRIGSCGDSNRWASGQCTPSSIGASGCALPCGGKAKCPLEHQGQSSAWSQSPGSLSYPTSSEPSLPPNPKCMSMPHSSHGIDSHDRSRDTVRSSFSSSLAPDHLKSALEAMVAMSLSQHSTDYDTGGSCDSHSPVTPCASSLHPLSLLAGENLNYEFLSSMDSCENMGTLGDDDPHPRIIPGQSIRNQLSTVAEDERLDSKDSSSRVGDADFENECSLQCLGDNSTARVEVESEKGKGEVVVVPRQLRPLCFLIVDDSAVNRRMLRRLLFAHEHRTLEATDGRDCLAVWETASEHVDVVLMDNLMPIMTGPQAASVMRARGFGGLIIGVSGHAQKDDIEDFKRCGADAVLAKPVNFVELEALVEKLRN